MSAQDPLLRPFRLKHLALRNRTISASHTMLYAVDGGFPKVVEPADIDRIVASYRKAARCLRTN